MCGCCVGTRLDGRLARTAAFSCGDGQGTMPRGEGVGGNRFGILAVTATVYSFSFQLSAVPHCSPCNVVHVMACDRVLPLGGVRALTAAVVVAVTTSPIPCMRRLLWLHCSRASYPHEPP